MSPITSQQKDEINTKQKNAATDSSSQVLVVAGPGTGKSVTIAKRVHWLLNVKNIDPRSIFVISFTRESARDLQSKVYNYCVENNIPDNKVRKAQVSTLHSLALRILRKGKMLKQYPAEPMVMDRWECRDIFDAEFRFWAREKKGFKNFKKKRCEEIRRYHEAYWSTRQWNPPNYIPPDPPVKKEENDAFDTFHMQRGQVYSCVLPGEIVRQCVDKIKSGTLNPTKILSIEYLIVDEFQDLNPCDLEFVDELIKNDVKTFVTGDDDQSIYSFRFASPAGIQDFKDKYPQVKIHSLTDCLRCTREILSAAKTLIDKYSPDKRIKKEITSVYLNSDPPVVGQVYRWKFDTDQREAEIIAKSCRNLIKKGIDSQEILILINNKKVLKTNLVNALDKYKVPYSFMESDKRPYEPVKFIHALLRIVCNKNDYVAHRVLVGSLPGVGLSICNTIAEKVVEKSLNFRDLFYNPLPSSVFDSRSTKALRKAKEILTQISNWQDSYTLNQRRNDITQLLDAHFNNKTNSQGKNSYIEIWGNVISDLPPDITLKEMCDYFWIVNDVYKARFLEGIYERIGKSSSGNSSPPSRVRVMSIHNAKGLSAHVVFIPGLEDELLPGSKNSRYPGLVQESARLLYTAITRARIACVLSYAKKRRMYGREVDNTPSRFLDYTAGKFSTRTSSFSTSELSSIFKASKNI